MNDIEWPDEAPAKKGGIPKWVWIGCGGGCLLALLVGAIAAFFMFRFFQDMQDPEKVWPLVEDALPFDERPEGWTVIGGGALGTYQITMKPPGIDSVAILHIFKQSQPLKDLFDPESLPNNLPMMSIESAEPGEMEIQGRTTTCLRFKVMEPLSQKVQPCVRVDLTGGGALYVCFQVFQAGDEPVPDELVQRMLEPFDVWRGK